VGGAAQNGLGGLQSPEPPPLDPPLYMHGHHSVWVTDAWRVLQATYLPGRNLDQHDGTDTCI
jgi:hypothetical protein